MNINEIATSHVFCNLIGPHDFMRRVQVDDASDTRPFHVDAKGRGGQTIPRPQTESITRAADESVTNLPACFENL